MARLPRHPRFPPARVALYAATVAILATSGAAVAGHPPPLPWAGLALAGYATLLLGGVFTLRWRVFVDAVVRGPKGARGVVLTFDDGPDPRYTPRILAALAKHSARATFFLVGHKVEAHPEVVRAILDAGHAIGLHSYAHDRLFSLRGEAAVRADLERGQAAIAAVAGAAPVLFRPPIGHTNPRIARAADALGLTVVGWTVGARDGLARTRPAEVVSRVRRAARDGAIVLLHDAPERGDREPAAVKALPALLDALATKRLPVVPLSAWLPPTE